MGKASCGRREPLSGAVCTLPYDHVGEHKDLSDWRVLVYFGDKVEDPPPLILPGDVSFGAWTELWGALQSERA